MRNDFNDNIVQRESAAIDVGLRQHMIRVYNYMGIGLLISGVVSYFIGTTPAITAALFGNPMLAIVIAFAPLIMVFVMAAKVKTMSFASAQLCFWIFATLMGVSLASIFITYTTESIAKVFFIAASMFGAMSVYGYTTKRDLTGLGSFLFMGLVGIIIASIVNIFIGSSALGFAISVLGVLIFTGLTAYDTQKIKEMYYEADSGEVAGKKAVWGALTLYLDFINLFIMLLHLFGDRR
jgi:uncharacterized protein